MVWKKVGAGRVMRIPPAERVNLADIEMLDE